MSSHGEVIVRSSWQFEEIVAATHDMFEMLRQENCGAESGKSDGFLLETIRRDANFRIDKSR